MLRIIHLQENRPRGLAGHGGREATEAGGACGENTRLERDREQKFGGGTLAEAVPESQRACMMRAQGVSPDRRFAG